MKLTVRNKNQHSIKDQNKNQHSIKDQTKFTFPGVDGALRRKSAFTNFGVSSSHRVEKCQQSSTHRRAIEFSSRAVSSRAPAAAQ
jgi:hypothetical protein